MTGLKESKSNDFLLRNYPSECNKLFIHGLENSSRLFGSSPICHIDEAHFWLNGYVNKQNCRIWSEANPQVYVETPLHPEKLTVWCALWAGGIIGPYFFKNDGPSGGSPSLVLWQTRTEWNEVVSDGFFTIGMMTQQTAPWENWHLERGVELLKTFGLVRWGLGGSGHVEGTGEKLSFASQAAR
ncbi:hypothetical protein TNCV_129361 [Trichonephila clavipes]|nr:hypothetical protein TNCV_129361 [Trichonephila clavipes]